MSSTFRTTSLILGLLLFFAVESALARKTEFAKKTPREDYIRRADVWLAPAWISKDFKFSHDLDVYTGPKVKKDAEAEEALRQKTVVCETTQELLNERTAGRTDKFRCHLKKYDHATQQWVLITGKKGKPKKIKVKYRDAESDSKEVFAEVAGTRLLWALGFGADRMFAPEQTYCYGCSTDPFIDRKLDLASLGHGRVFNPSAIELKFDGDEIEDEDIIIIDHKLGPRPRTTYRKVSSWVAGEMMELVSDDPVRRREQLTHRGALRLLGSVLVHIDNKPDNQRIVCLEDLTKDGRCEGKTLLMINDIGSGFGQGVKGLSMSKWDVARWAKRKVWANPEKCVANLGPSYEDPLFGNPKISEEGRKFLADLLAGFSEGEAGLKRVRDMFRATRSEENGFGTVEEWTQAFLTKVEQVRFPLGRGYPNFQCPKRVK